MPTGLEYKVEKARSRYEENPTVDNLIWYGRRVGYTGRYEESIEIYSMGLKEFPNSPEILRHRGHRYISLRKFDKAIEDLKKAKSMIHNAKDKIEEDGMPNSKGIPLSTLHFNIYYHLGLAYYLEHQLEEALVKFSNCLEVSRNDDSIIACSYWLYLIYKKLGEENRFQIPENLGAMEIIENYSYYHLLRLYLRMISKEELLQTVENSLDQSTIGYGLAMHYFFRNDKEKAEELLKQNIEENHPAAFGTIASVIELKRLE